MGERSITEFEKVASTRAGTNILGEFWYFLRHSKKYWLLPILILCLLLGALMLLSVTAAAPFIYTVF